MVIERRKRQLDLLLTRSSSPEKFVLSLLDCGLSPSMGSTLFIHALCAGFSAVLCALAARQFWLLAEFAQRL